MLALGIGGGLIEYEGDAYIIGSHDSSACLVKDGTLLAAIEEERLDRLKFSFNFPVNALRSCLKETNTSLADIDVIGYRLPIAGIGERPMISVRQAIRVIGHS